MILERDCSWKEEIREEAQGNTMRVFSLVLVVVFYVAIFPILELMREVFHTADYRVSGRG